MTAASEFPPIPGPASIAAVLRLDPSTGVIVTPDSVLVGATGATVSVRPETPEVADELAEAFRRLAVRMRTEDAPLTPVERLFRAVTP